MQTTQALVFPITELLTKSVLVFDLSAFEGLIEADLKGSVFADDSTLLVDAVSGTHCWSSIFQCNW